LLSLSFDSNGFFLSDSLLNVDLLSFSGGFILDSLGFSGGGFLFLDSLGFSGGFLFLDSLSLSDGGFFLGLLQLQRFLFIDSLGFISSSFVLISFSLLGSSSGRFFLLDLLGKSGSGFLF